MLKYTNLIMSLLSKTTLQNRPLLWDNVQVSQRKMKSARWAHCSSIRSRLDRSQKRSKQLGHKETLSGASRCEAHHNIYALNSRELQIYQFFHA